MAKKQVAEQIPFSEGAPPDDLQVEVIGDEVLIGDPELDNIKETESNFDANLAEDMSDKELNSTASDLVGFYNTDREARSEWEERYKKDYRLLSQRVELKSRMKRELFVDCQLLFIL